MYDIKPDFGETKVIYILLAIFTIVIFIVTIIVLENLYAFFMMMVVTISIFVVLYTIAKTGIDIDKKNYQRLQEHGVLVKGVKCKYELKEVDEHEKNILVVMFKSPEGKNIRFERELEKHEKWQDLKELDLLLDPEDYNNYRLEPQINRVK